MNWETILLAVIAATPPTLVAWAALHQGKKNADALNGRMSQLLEVSTKDAKAEGVKEESERAATAAIGGRRTTDTHGKVPPP